jgi:hypothetical protein
MKSLHPGLMTIMHDKIKAAEQGRVDESSRKSRTVDT